LTGCHVNITSVDYVQGGTKTQLLIIIAITLPTDTQLSLQ